MKKRIYAILMALLLSTVTLAGCGDSGSRDRYEDDGGNKDSKSSSSKKDYEKDIAALIDMMEEFEDLSNDFLYVSDYDDYQEVVDDMYDLIDNLKVQTPEGKKIKSSMKEVIEILDKMGKYADKGDQDKANEMQRKGQDVSDEVEDLVEDFIDAAEKKGVDDDDLEDLRDAFGI